MANPRVALTLEQLWHRVPGGSAVAALGMARALDRRSDATVVGVAARHAREPDPPWTPPIPVKHLSLPRAALYESWHRFRRPAVESATGPVDVVHATTIAVPPRRAPLVVTIHDLAFLHEPDHFTRRGLAFFNKGLDIARDEADMIVCPSDATARDCIDRGFQSDRVLTVPLGVDISPARAKEVESVLSRYGIERPYVLWTGTIEPRKNLRGLIAAWRKIRSDVNLVLAGPRGWNEDLDDLLDGTDRTRALGFVPFADLGPLYAGATAFCWPSFLEGFGFPVLEAMAQGTPVVTSRGSSTEEIAGEAAVLVDPKDPDGIAEGLAQVLDDADLRARLSHAGRERASSYTWDRTADMLLDAYAQVIGVRTP